MPDDKNMLGGKKEAVLVPVKGAVNVKQVKKGMSKVGGPVGPQNKTERK